MVLFTIAFILSAVFLRLAVLLRYSSLDVTTFNLGGVQNTYWIKTVSDFFMVYIIKAAIIMICMLAAKTTRGIFPAVLVFLIGCMLGIFIALINISKEQLLTGISFYYLFDLVSLCWACSIGSLKISLKDKMYLFIYPMALLFLGSGVRLINTL